MRGELGLGSLSQQSACVHICEPRSIPEAHINSAVAYACSHSTGEAVTEETEILDSVVCHSSLRGEFQASEEACLQKKEGGSEE